MSSRPISFIPPLAQAVHVSQKWHTRRLKGLELINEDPDGWAYTGHSDSHGFTFDQLSKTGDFPASGLGIKCPYGMPGDSLWVREPFEVREEPHPEEEFSSYVPIIYYRDGSRKLPPLEEYLAWERSLRSNQRSALGDHPNATFMPKFASRSKRKIERVWPERLNDISRGDAAAEGVCYLWTIGWKEMYRDLFVIQGHHWPEQNFVRLFNYLNAKRIPYDGWNPWVFAIELERPAVALPVTGHCSLSLEQPWIANRGVCVV